MATIKVSGPEAGEDERKLTPAEAKMVLDAKIRKEFRWAVRSLVGDDGNQMQSFDGGVFERVVADIRDGIIAEMRYNDDIRRAIRVGVKNFNAAYVKGVLKKALKGNELPNPGIIMSAAEAVAELDEDSMPSWLKKKIQDKKDSKKKDGKKKKKGKGKGKGKIPPQFLSHIGKK